MKTFAAFVVCALTTFLWEGCKPYDISPSAGMGDPYPAPMNDPRITILSPELRPWLGFQPAIVTKDSDRPMMVEIPVRNMTYNPYNIEYRILFFDENDRQLDSVKDWEFVRMEPKQLVRFKRSALSTEAKDYRIEVKWSK